MGATKIRKEQIRIDEFIQSLASANWNSDILTVSAAAILAKIQSEIAAVSGAMNFRGSWIQAATDTIKKGYVYVFDGQGTAPTGVTLENGDTLIAKQDSASISNLNHWTIVQVNITGAVTEANLADELSKVLKSNNENALVIDKADGKLLLSVKFPTAAGAAESYCFVTGIKINSVTGAVSYVTGHIVQFKDFLVLEAVCGGDPNGVNMVFKTPTPVAKNTPHALFINGVKQTEGRDFDYLFTYVKDEPGSFTINNSSYIPKVGDTVTCMYVMNEGCVSERS